MDEMGKKIELISYSYGYKVLFFGLLVWSLIEQSKYVFEYGENNLLPAIILTTGWMIQELSKMYMRKKMVADDEEYKEPRKISDIIKIVWAISFTILNVAVLLKIVSENLF